MIPDPHSLSIVHAQALPERVLDTPGQKHPGNGAKKINIWKSI